MQEKAARLYEHLTGGIFFDPERVFTKSCLERIVTDVLFSEAELAVLQEIEVCAPPSEALGVIVPPRTVPCVWLLPAFEGEANEVAKTKIAWALASAIAISKGLGRDQVLNDARYTMLRWGFTVPEQEAA